MEIFILLPWLIIIYSSAIKELRLWKLVAGGFIFALMCTSGFPNYLTFVIFIWAGIGAALTINQVGIEGRKAVSTSLSAAFAIIILGLGLSAVYFIPVLDGVRYTRLHVGLSPEQAIRQVDVNLPPLYLATLFLPGLFGNITGTDFIFPQNVFFPDANMSAGAALTFLAVLGFALSITLPAVSQQERQRRRLAIAAAGLYVFAILCALGGNTPFYRHTIGYLPLIGGLPSPIRYRAIQCFAAAVLAALGSEALLRGSLSGKTVLLRRLTWGYVAVSFLVIAAALTFPFTREDMYRNAWQGNFASKADGYFFIRQSVGSYSPATSRVKKVAALFSRESRGQIRYADNNNVPAEGGILVGDYYAPARGWFEFGVDIPPGKFVWIYPKEGTGSIGYSLQKSSITCFDFSAKKWLMHTDRSALCLYTGAKGIRSSFVSRFRTGDIPRRPMAASLLYYILISLLIILCVYRLSPRRLGMVLGVFAIGELLIFSIPAFYGCAYRPGIPLPHQIGVARPADYPLLRRMLIQLPAVAQDSTLRIATDQPFQDNFAQLNGRFALMGYQMHPMETRFKLAVETAYGQPMDWPIYEESPPRIANPAFLSNFSVGYLLTADMLPQFRSRISIPLPGEDGLFVHINNDALPRAFTMDRIITAQEDEQLKQLVSGDLHQAVYVSPLDRIGEKDGIISSPAHYSFLQKANSIKKINFDNPNRVDVEINVTVPAMLVLTEVWFPGWEVTVDKRPAKIYRVNYCQRGVWLEKGEHKVAFCFRPLAWRIGGIITLASAILMLLFFLGDLFSSRRRGKR